MAHRIIYTEIDKLTTNLPMPAAGCVKKGDRECRLPEVTAAVGGATLGAASPPDIFLQGRAIRSNQEKNLVH